MQGHKRPAPRSDNGGAASKHPRQRGWVGAPRKSAADRAPSLFETLVAADLRQDRNVLLQVFRYEPDRSSPAPALFFFSDIVCNGNISAVAMQILCRQQLFARPWQGSTHVSTKQPRGATAMTSDALVLVPILPMMHAQCLGARAGQSVSLSRHVQAALPLSDSAHGPQIKPAGNPCILAGMAIVACHVSIVMQAFNGSMKHDSPTQTHVGQ
jgi:hypothetical protein